MDSKEYMKRTANPKTIWINTAGTGVLIATHLETQGIPVNRFTLLDSQELRQYLDKNLIEDK